MKYRARDLDAFEREWLASEGPSLEGLRAARAHCPPLALLRAALVDPGVLPDSLRAAVAAHLASCRSCAGLQRDLELVEAGASGAPGAEPRVLERVYARARAERAGAAWSWGWWRAAAAAAAAVIVFAVPVAWWVSRSPGPAPVPPVPRTASLPETPPAAEALSAAFALDKPEVRLTLGSLTWRGARGTGGNFLADLAPALDALREDRYADADRIFAALAPAYPGRVEVHFYLGVSRLFLGDDRGAVAALQQAAAVGGEGFADDVHWYLGLALARQARIHEAEAELSPLCAGEGPRRARACAALAELRPRGAR